MFSSKSNLYLWIYLLTLIQPSVAVQDCFGGKDHSPYIDWVADRGTSYTAAVCFNATSTDTTQGVAIHWRLDDDNIYIAVAARATGWAAFGLAEGGGMKGADVVIFETAKPGEIRDAHVLDERIPVDDICQDWVFVDSQTEDDFLIFEAYRKLDTMDSQDHRVVNDTNTYIPAQRVIAAWGDSSTATYHGRNTARGSLRWYGGGDELTIIREKLMAQADGYFDLLIPNHTLAAKATDYVSFCFVWDPDLTSQKIPPNSTIAVIAADMIIRDETRPYVHHSDVFATAAASNESRKCIESGYGYSLYSWAPGLLPLILPENVGYEVGPSSSDGLQSFRLQMHYNNPDLVENVTDNGGLRVYYSLTPREHKLGIMALGDVLSKLNGFPIPSGISQYDFACDAACSSLALDEPVTVIQELVHMHIAGAAAATYHIRDGEIIRQGNVDFFDFNQAGLAPIRQAPYTINPGDSFISKFWYNSENGTTFGRASYEEMNEAIFLYYPAKTLLSTSPWACTYDIFLTACNATMTNRALSSSEDIERIFGKTPAMCYKSAEPVSNTSTTTSTSAGSNHFQACYFHYVCCFAVVFAVVVFVV